MAAAVGQRLVDKTAHGHWKTLTFVAALRADRITAPALFDEPINGRSFLAYVQQALANALKPGDIVIMDNLGSHKGQAVRRATREAGAKLFFLPPYSPDLNPIEQVFSKLKNTLRTAAKTNVTGLTETIADALDAFTPNQRANYLRHAGYAAA